MTISEFLQRLNKVKSIGENQWGCLCPAHDDQRSSLCVSASNDGKILIKCQAGCLTETIVSKMGLTMVDLFPDKQATAAPIIPKIVDVYSYTDASGKLLYQVCRYKPKDFRQRRPDGNGGWIWNMNGTQRVLYKLPKVIEGVKAGQIIWIVEGEKAVYAAEAIGFVATNAPGGAGKWKDEYNEVLKGAVCNIIPDNDDPGRKHAKLVADSLRGIAKLVCIVELPGLPPKGDLYDFVSARQDKDTEDTKQEIFKIMAPPKPIEPQQKTTSISDKNRFQIFYNGASKGFLAPDDRGGWVSLSETQIKRLLRSKGVEKNVQKGELVSEIENELLMIQTTQNVDYSGPLAGHYAGVLQIANHRILATESPTIIEPKEGDWSTYKTIIEGLLGAEQLPFFYGWVKVAYESLRAGVRTPGQAMAMAGPRNGGKSLIQNLLTPIFGGRCSRPYEYMTAVSPFNSHLFGAEHLMVEDEAPSTDLRARRAFGAQIKSITVNLEAQCHAKGQTPIMLRPFWRLSITLNDEPENLMVLPPMDESLFDKLTLFKTNYQEMPMPTASPSDRSAFWEKLVSELPAFLAFLAQWQIPPEMVSQRFGVIHYHHHEIMEALNELAPEHRLLSLIDGYLFNGLDPSWTGTAEQLERSFTNSESKCRFEASQLFKFNVACGTYLGRLAKRYPKRFEHERNGSIRTWTIFAQNQENEIPS